MSNTVMIVKNKLDAFNPKITRENLEKANKSFIEGVQEKYECRADDSTMLYEQCYAKGKRRGYILFVSYKNDGKIYTKKENIKDTQIESIYVGIAEIKKRDVEDSYDIFYVMKKCIMDKKVIINMLDGIAMNIIEDYERCSYVMVRNIESFADSIRDILVTQKQPGGFEKYKEFDDKYELAEYAQKNCMCKRMYGLVPIDESRSEFQRDRERIVNSKAFRRLVDKAQIFSAEKGDHYRTRMTHTLEVNQIAKAIAKGLYLNIDLTEAIALAHDLGHTPFGHQGERTIRDIMAGEKLDDLFKLSDESLYNRLGGFKHNYQGVRILTKLEEKYVEHLGLDVSIQVLEGVLKHTALKDANVEEFIDNRFVKDLHIDKDFCSSLEGQVVNIADEIAQRGHDIDDAITSGLMDVNELLDSLNAYKFKALYDELNEEIVKFYESNRRYIDGKKLIIGRIISCIVGYFINDVVKNSSELIEEYEYEYKEGVFKKKLIDFSNIGRNCCEFLEKLINKRVIADSEVTRFDYNAEVVITKLFKSYYCNPKLLHSGTLRKIYIDTLLHNNEDVSNSAIDLLNGNIDVSRQEIDTIITTEIGENPIGENLVIFEKKKILIRNIADYIAGMTDSYALKEYDRIK